MTALLDYAKGEISRRGFADSQTNCHGIVAFCVKHGHVRLIDGIGLDVVCRTTEEIDNELSEMSEWYAESEGE